MTHPTPTPMLYDAVLARFEHNDGVPFPEAEGAQHVQARYVWPDGSYIAITPRPGGIIVRTSDRSGNGRMAVMPMSSNVVHVLLTEPSEGDPDDTHEIAAVR